VAETSVPTIQLLSPLPKPVLAAQAAFALRVANAKPLVSTDDHNVSLKFRVHTAKNSGPRCQISCNGHPQKPRHAVQVQMESASASTKGAHVQARKTNQVKSGLHSNGGFGLGRRHVKVKPERQKWRKIHLSPCMLHTIESSRCMYCKVRGRIRYVALQGLDYFFRSHLFRQLSLVQTVLVVSLQAHEEHEGPDS